MRMDLLQARVNRAQIALQLHPDSPSNQKELAEARDMLQSLETGAAAWVDQVMQARWVAEGDKCTKLFFKSFKSMASAKQIHPR